MTMMTEATHGSSPEQAPKACDGGMSVLNKSAHNEIHCGYSGVGINGPGIGDPRTHGDPLSQHSIAYITVNFHT